MVAPSGAESGRFVSDIFREIDEELRRENFAKLWSRYGVYIIALAVVIVLAAAGVVGWRQYQARQYQMDGVRYAEALALAQQGKDSDAAAAFDALAQQASGGHAVLARFEEAALKAKGGDPAAAVAIYHQLSQNGSVGQTYRDLATLMAARYELDKGDPKAIIAQLAPLTDANNPWHPTALELTALAQIKAGDKAAARTTYQHIADDLRAPQSLRARATEMAAALSQ
jgi:hypothetical protein